LFRCPAGGDSSIFVQSDSQPFPEAAQKISRNLIEVIKLPAALFENGVELFQICAPDQEIDITHRSQGRAFVEPVSDGGELVPYRLFSCLKNKKMF